MKINTYIALAASIAMVLSQSADAAGLFTNGVPQAGGAQYPSTVPLTGNELLPADTQLPSGLNPASESISTNQIVAFAGGVPAKLNALIGGDATSNLFQRGTTGASQTTTVAYGGPDRWVYWSGLNTAMTVSRDSTAGDVPAGYQYAFKMARTSGQTGVVQVCMAQEIESIASYAFQGQVTELDFHAATGANYSPASANVTAYIISGTGQDEGTTKLAWGLNAGGGGSSGWTGQANATAAVIGLGGTSKIGRYAAIGTVPAGATELAVALCFTPVGTAGTNDYVAFSGIQLVRNPAIAALASTTTGVSCASAQCSSFQRRPEELESSLQQRYTYSIGEVGSASHPVLQITGASGTTTNCVAFVPFPVTMRAAPTYANALSATTFKLLPITGTATVLSTPFSAYFDSTSGNSVNGGSLTFTSSTVTQTAGWGCAIEGIGGTGQLLFSAEL